MLHNDDARKQLGLCIRKLREENDYSIKDFAYKIDMGYSNLIRSEKGRTNVRLSSRVKIANGLNVSLIELFK